MGDYAGSNSPPVDGSATEIAAHIAAMAGAGADHVQLVVDPITIETVDALSDVLDALD
jgi:hypothetical protein